MSGERRIRILARLADGAGPDFETRRLCEVGAQVTGTTGAGIMLMTGDVPSGSVCTSDEVTTLVGDLQFELGEGPCIDAYHEGRPALEADLAAPRTIRWQGFAAPAVEAGVRAIFGFPVQVGAARLGVFHVYRDQVGALSDEEHADALVIADVAAHTVLLLQANAPPGRLAAELEAGGFQYVVHQATGMVAAQLGVTVAQALVRLRAHAFGGGRTLGEVAQAVVARTLRFEE